jgi:hypothetical protein
VVQGFLTEGVYVEKPRNSISRVTISRASKWKAGMVNLIGKEINMSITNEYLQGQTMSPKGERKKIVSCGQETVRPLRKCPVSYLFFLSLPSPIIHLLLFQSISLWNDDGKMATE